MTGFSSSVWVWQIKLSSETQRLMADLFYFLVAQGRDYRLSRTMHHCKTLVSMDFRVSAEFPKIT